MSARLWLSTSCRMPGLALRTCALHWRSSVPEPLSSRAAQPICSLSCGTTTLAKCPSARSHPICVPWRPGPMRPNLRPHLTVSPEPICVPLSSRCVRPARRLHVAPAASTAHATTWPRVPCVCSCAAPKPHGRPTHVNDTYRSSPEYRWPPSWLLHIRPRRVTCAPLHLVPRPRRYQTCPVHPLIFQVVHVILPHTQHSLHLGTVASFISSISNASTMMTINGWPFCSLPTTTPPPKLGFRAAWPHVFSPHPHVLRRCRTSPPAYITTARVQAAQLPCARPSP
jgi:hypothetical protein